jgi:hypothetical protein
MVCGVPLAFKVTFYKAIEICATFGARLPDVVTGFDQRSIERKKVINSSSFKVKMQRYYPAYSLKLVNY